MSHINLCLNLKFNYQGPKYYIKIGEPQKVQENILKLSGSCRNTSLIPYMVVSLQGQEFLRDLPKLLLLIILKTTLQKGKKKIPPSPLTLYLPNHKPALKASKIDDEFEPMQESTQIHLLCCLCYKKKKASGLTSLKTNRKHYAR